MISDYFDGQKRWLLFLEVLLSSDAAREELAAAGRPVAQATPDDHDSHHVAVAVNKVNSTASSRLWKEGCEARQGTVRVPG